MAPSCVLTMIAHGNSRMSSRTVSGSSSWWNGLRSISVHFGACGRLGDGVDEGVVELDREVVAHALDLHVLGAADGPCGGSPAGPVHERVVGAVHDGDRHVDLREPLR